MARRHTYATTISFGGDTPTAELEVEFSYTVVWGAPEQGPTYASGGQPADPDEIDDIKVVSVNERPSGWSEYQSDADVAETLIEALSEDDYARMLEEASEAEAPDPDDSRDRMFDEGRF